MRLLLRFLSLIWLGIVIPLFGIIPLWCYFVPENGSTPLCNIHRAFLLTIWTLFFSDPAPHVSDATVPITKGQAIWLLIIIFSIAGLALYYCFLWWNESKKDHKPAVIGVGRADWFRLLPPPNRTGGSPASGSPVGGSPRQGLTLAR